MLSKRQKFIAVTFVLTTFLGVSRSLVGWRQTGVVIGFPFLSASLMFLVLRKGLDRDELLPLLSPPFLLSLGYALIFRFFPNFNSFFVAIILLSFFASFYSLVLACNIFSVAGAKSVLLLKPAQTAFLFVLLTAFFLLNTHLAKWGGFFLVQQAVCFLLMWFLSFLVFWTQTLGKSMRLSEKQAREWAFFVAVTAFLGVWGLAFLKLEPFFRALVLTASYNAVLGIFLAKQLRQLSNRIIIEYLFIPLLALGFSLLVS